MTNAELLDWLLQGDVSIRFQALRDLAGKTQTSLQKRIATEGWGKQFLALRNANGYWGRAFYQPKWTSAHYTMLDLKLLGISPEIPALHETAEHILAHEKGSDGGVNPARTVINSDVCVNGMVMNYACYFGVKENGLHSVVDFLLEQVMPDGGFNCQSNQHGAVHSSLHTTMSVLEGILEYESNGYTYRLQELKRAAKTSHEFILLHRLFRSDKTGKIIRPEFLRLYYPTRWFYDILRALDYFRAANVRYDKRMQDAIDVVLSKRMKSGQWKLPAKHPGLVHFEMEKAGEASRWNTLRAMRVLQHFGKLPEE